MNKHLTSVPGPSVVVVCLPGGYAALVTEACATKILLPKGPGDADDVIDKLAGVLMSADIEDVIALRTPDYNGSETMWQIMPDGDHLFEGNYWNVFEGMYHKAMANAYLKMPQVEGHA